MGLEGPVRADFKGLPPGKTLDFFSNGQWEAITRLSILSFDAAVCLADFALRTSFRLSSTFQDMSIIPYLISCGATQTTTTIVFTLPPSLLLQLCLLPPSIDRSTSRLQLFFSLQPLQLTVLCLPSLTAGHTLLHNPAKGPKSHRGSGSCRNMQLL